MKVGIHENLVLRKVDFNDKGTLVLNFRPADLEVQEKDTDGGFKFEEEESAEIESTNDGTSNILLFCPNVPDKLTVEDPVTKEKRPFNDEEKVQFIGQDFRNLANQLKCIMAAYMPVKDKKFVPYKNTGITETNYKVEFLDAENLKKVYHNYGSQFKEFMAPYLDKNENPVRLKLIRQSKVKHYGTLPNKFLDTNPFIEPMEVPVESSRVRFTKYEMEKGLDNPEPVSQAQGADKTPEVTPEASNKAFGSDF